MVVGEFTQEAQLVVIGGGPGGYSAAFRAAELGIETVLIDSRAELGGVCLHEGCIPSKTLLHIAETIRQGEHAGEFGVHFNQPRIDLEAVRAWVDRSVENLSKGLRQSCKRHNVEHIQGDAVFEDSRRLAVRNSTIPRVRFRRAIIAAGGAAKAHPVLTVDGKRVLSPQQAVKLHSVPKSLLIVGGEYNAVELALIYSTFGSSVTLVHEDDRLLSGVDTDLVRPLSRQLERRLSHVCLSTSVQEARLEGESLHITFSGPNVPTNTTFDQAIVAMGYEANISSLDLGKTSVSLDEFGFIVTDDQQRTSDPRIFAVGDVTGDPLLADHALAQGRVAAEVIAGWNSRMDQRAVPRAVFSDPQIAWCGLSEQDAKAAGVPYQVVKQPWGASGRAVGMGRVDGMSKIIFDPDTQLILGMGIVGPHAAELISEGALAIEMGAVVTDLACTVRPHPTLSEMLSIAAQNAESRGSNTSES